MHKRDPTCAACVFLLLLLLTPVSPQCRQGTAAECRKACIVPGGEHAGIGLDITKLSSIGRFWADGWILQDAECTLCVNPLLKGKPLQRLPLYIGDWKVDVSCQHKVHHSVQNSVISVAEALTELQAKNDWTTELDVMVNSTPMTQWALAGSRSKWTEDCIRKQSFAIWNKYIFLLHHVTCSYYKARISKDRLVSEDFKDHLKALPEKYDSSSKIEYFRLIQLFGTHIGTEIDLGAHIRYLTAVPICKAVLEGISVSELSRCLAIDLGVEFGFDGVTNSSDFQMCEEKKKNPNYYHLLEIIISEWWGGNQTLKTYTEWVESAKKFPDVLFYSLEPIHTLVAKDNPRREGLRQAVSEYVKKRALWRDCSQPCPPGSQPSASDFCSCECPNNNFTNSMCCTLKRGLAKLTVTIIRAEGLWGDYISHSDGYGRVVFQNTEKCTHIVWNNNNPIWNVNFDFGVFQLYENFNELLVEVWDADFGWNDDLLGSCQLTVAPWKFESRTCFLKNGLLHFKYEVVCGPNMYGRSCSDYSSLWGNNHNYYYES